MPTTAPQLRQLRERDRLKYHGVLWTVKDYSTYTDDHGYETEEWLLKSQTSKEYYLLREVDPVDPESQVHWFLAEEVRRPAIYEPDSSREIAVNLAAEMRSHREPYPHLKMYNRTYEFESQTEGEYVSDGESKIRTTWDYWDDAHLWNLALEAWSENTLVVYSTREVQPEDFTEVTWAAKQTSYSAPVAYVNSVKTDRSREYAIAWAMVVGGFLLMLMGI
ncbi:MAG TPA: DUF4178 domain-containing protein [Thermosynechococcaceae cyanobacterium]